jgi:hypothetical protein
MVEAKIAPSVVTPPVSITPVQTPSVFISPKVQQVTGPIPASSVNPKSKKGGKWLLIFFISGIAIYTFRYEIGYYIFGKPNKKYPLY